MRYLVGTRLAVTLGLLASPVTLRSQQLPAQLPTPAQAQALLKSRPDLVQKLQQKLKDSGLTPDQIRARLREAGYPETMLDQYLPNGNSDSLTVPSADVFAAVRQLGLSDSTDFPSVTPDTSKPAPNLPVAADSGNSIFGLDVFRHATSLFQPALDGPVDDNYRLGPGDVLVLILTGDVESASTLEVTREGFIVIPDVGQVYVANLTLGELNEVLYKRLGRVYSGVRKSGGTTQFHVSVAKLRTVQVFVVGDVAVPGSYQISSAGTALTALYAAGGPSDNGSLRHVEVRRGGRVVDSLDVYDYLLRGDASHDVRLQTGDVIFVAVHGPRVRITGEVVRPDIYEMKTGETLGDLIRASGGFTATASRRRVQIQRILPPTQRGPAGRDRVVIDVSADQFDEEAAPGLALAPGDDVQVFPVADRVGNQISVIGNVWAPGTAGFTPGMRLSEAIRLAGGPKPDSYLGRILITRLRPDSSRIQLHSAFRDSTGAVTDDIPLAEDDEIQVFSRSSFRPDRYIVIGGAVRNGGRIPYREGMTLRDAVLLAGGLQQSAYLKEAEVARLPENRDQGTLATTLRVPLDSTYLFERGPNGEYLGPPGLPAPSRNAPEVTLRPYDNVLIMHQPDWELQRIVYVGGAVRFPGNYSLTSQGERLSDVLARAGGLTREGYADGIVLYRNEDRTGRIGIDLPAVLKNPKSSDNIILQDGDSIFIPEYNPVVRVEGAVNSPVAVTYHAGANLDYYIRAAGGATRTADVGRAYVRQPNGEVETFHHRPLFIPDGVPQPRAGSVVIVPERDPSDRIPWSSIAAPAAQILASLVAIVAVLKR